MNLRWLVPPAVAAVLLGGAQLLGTRAVVFPEGVALAFGACTLGRPDWCCSRVRLVLAPLLCAICGTASVWLVPSVPGAAMLALTMSAVVLLLLPSRVGPALSAGVLPAVFAVHSWIYPAAVLVLAVLVACCVRVRREAPFARWPVDRLAVVWLAGVLWIGVVAVAGLPVVAMAPPLLVSCLEHVVAPAPAAVVVRRSVLLPLCWVSGALAAWWLPPLTVVLVVAVVLVVLRYWQVPHAPILAMVLVPQVAGAPGSVADLGSGALGIIAAVAVLNVLVPMIAVPGSDSTPPGSALLRRFGRV